MFSNLKCPVCGVRFKDGDDVVVCPVCGTPHHKKCFDKTKTCYNQALHEKGWSLSEEIKQKQKEQELKEHREFIDKLKNFKKDAGGIFCANCGALNPSDGIFCIVCGHKLLSEDKYIKKIDYDIFDSELVLKTKKHKINYNDNINGVPTKEYAAFVGINIDYFLPLFEQFQKKKVSFNLSVLLLCPVYCYYRKMWGLGTVTSLLMFLFFTSTLIFYIFATKMPPNPFILNFIFGISATLSGILFLIVMYSFLFINYRYYKKAKKAIAELKSDNKNQTQYYAKLQNKGFVNINAAIVNAVVWIVLFAVCVIIMSI